MIIKNLENKIKLAGILSIGCFATSIVISGMVLAFCFSLVKAERKKIYVLDNGPCTSKTNWYRSQLGSRM